MLMLLSDPFPTSMRPSLACLIENRVAFTRGVYVFEDITGEKLVAQSVLFQPFSDSEIKDSCNGTRAV